MEQPDQPTEAEEQEEPEKIPSVVLVLNRELLVQELCSLTQAYAARDLYIEPSDVSVELISGGDKMVPRFGVDREKASGFPPERIRSILESAYDRAREVMDPRLAQVMLRRRDYYGPRAEGGSR